MPVIPFKWMESTLWHREPYDWAGYAHGFLAPRVNVKGRMALVLLLAVVWAFGWYASYLQQLRDTLTLSRLLWRAYSVIQTPNEVLVDKLGLDIPPPPIVTLEEVGAKEIQISWKSVDANASLQEHHVEVNGRLVGVTRKHETAAAILNLKSDTLYDVRIFSVSTGRFQTPSALLRVKTTASPDQEGQTSRNDAPPSVRALAPRLPPTSSAPSVPAVAREASGGPVGRRGTTGRRASPAGYGGDTLVSQTDGSGKGQDEETDDSLAELSQRFQKVQQDIEAAEAQIQDEERDFEQQVKEMEAKRDELKQMLKERDEASSDLRKQVHKAEAANRTALSEKTKKERLLEQKQNHRRKRKDEMARWEDQTATMAEEMEGIKTQQAAIERRKQSEINEVRMKIEEEQREVAILEEENKEKALQIKALEEERKQLDAEDETEESLEVDRLEQEREMRWRERINGLTATYSRVLYDLQQAHQQYNMARERLAMYENHRRATMVSFAPSVPLDMDAVRRGTKPARRPRHASSHGSNVSSPRTTFGTESYNMSSHFSTTINASPTTYGPSFFNPQNGMTLMPPVDNSDVATDEIERPEATPMSPRADSLLPADLLGDESADELSHHGDDMPPRPISTKSQSPREGRNGSGSSSVYSLSPKSFTSPQEDLAEAAEWDRKSSVSPRDPDQTLENSNEDGTGTIKKSAMSHLFSFNRQRGKSMANQPPLLGSLKPGQSQSFPRNFDEFDPSAQPRRRLSYGGNWAFPGSGLIGRGHSTRESDRISSNRRTNPGLMGIGKSSATQNYDPFAPEHSLRGEASPSRPASVYSFDKMPRPSAESQFHAWAMEKGMRNSPLAPDWSSTISRNHSRRPSVHYGSTNNLPLGAHDSEEFLQPRAPPRPLQAPIGTRPVSSQRPATPKLNPAAPSFTMLFTKNREKAKEKAKAKEAKEAEKKEKEIKVYDVENSSPPESRKSKDTHSIAATASTYESRESLERTTSGYSGGGTPSENTPAKPTFISKITRKASSNKFGSWKGQGGIFSRKDGKESSTPTGEHEDDPTQDFFARSYESMSTTPVEDKDKKAQRSSLGNWNFIRKSKRGKEDLTASEVSESSEQHETASDIVDELDEEYN